MKKLFTTTFAICSVSFLFAGQEFPVIKNQRFLLNKDLQFANTLSLNLPDQNLITKKKGRGSDAFEEGVMVISAGYGFPNWGKSWLKIYESETGYKATGFGPMHVKFEYGLGDKFGLGASINYVAFGAEWSDDLLCYNSTTGLYYPGTEGIDISSLSFLVRMNLHFATSSKLDPYWGMGVGYKTWSAKWKTTCPEGVNESISNPIPVGWETTIGMRYYFTDNIGMYLEMGIAKSMLQAGLAIKL